MAILNLDKIIIERPVKSIRCTQCSGELVLTGKMPFIARLAAVLRFGRIKVRQYQCMDCKKKYHLV